ncbi:MAG: GNAT family N-acetyltransferase [Acidimicrobiales bacterium]
MDITLTGHGVEQFATPRLVGRRLLPADTDFLIELHSTEEVMALHGGARSRAATEPFVQSNVAHWRHYQFGLYVLSLAEEPDEPIGRAGIRWDRSVTTGPAVDLSVVLSKHVWGQGIATETMRAMATIGHDLDLPLVAGSEARHAAARRVLEKVGFIYGSEFERHSRGWVRYQWPVENPPPARISRSTAGRPA